MTGPGIKKICSIAGIFRHGISEIISMSAILFHYINYIKIATNDVNYKRKYIFIYILYSAAYF